MLLEDLRNTREDLERLEQAIAERSLEDPKHVSSVLRDLAIPICCTFVSRSLSRQPRVSSRRRETERVDLVVPCTEC